MSEVTRLDKVKSILNVTGSALDNTLNTYLDLAKDEILNWSFGGEGLDVPLNYQAIQVMAVVNGYNIRGAEGESSESVDGVSHQFKYADMLDYIHSNCPSFVRL